METRHEDGAAVRFPPPLIYLGSVLVGALLHALVLPLPLALSPGARAGVAGIMILSGLALMAGAIKLFRGTGQDLKPWEPTPEIISTGTYRFSRNPMYLGMALLQAGIGIALANGWIVVLVAPVLWLIYTIAIRPEEDYLEQKFGDAYAQYKASVRRWL